MSGPAPSASWPSTRQLSPGAVAIVTLPQSVWTSIEPPLDAKVPSRVGNAVVPPPWPHAPVENVPIPLLSKPPTIRPNVAATMIPPRKSKRVRLRMSPTPIPTRMSGHSVHSWPTWSSLRYPERTASGTAPARIRKTPQPRNPLRMCMAVRYPTVVATHRAECPDLP